jgi:hypothetical protein
MTTGVNPPQVIASASTVIDLELDDCQTLNASPRNNQPLQAQPCHIKWKSSSFFGTEVWRAISSWSSTGRVAFEGSETDATMFFADESDPAATGVARTVFLPGGFQVVNFNRYFLDGDPKREGSPSDYPPNDSSLTSWVAAHEVGHVLGFDHGSDRVSLMYYRMASYYVTGTMSPTADERDP